MTIKGRTQRIIEERWGMEFWALVNDFAVQGLTRQQTAWALGMSPNGLSRLLINHPSRDPFPPMRTKAQGFSLFSDSTFKQKVLELAKTMGLWRMANWFGYRSSSGMINAIRSYGFWEEFRMVRRNAMEVTA